LFEALLNEKMRPPPAVIFARPSDLGRRLSASVVQDCPRIIGTLSVGYRPRNDFGLEKSQLRNSQNRADTISVFAPFRIRCELSRNRIRQNEKSLVANPYATRLY